MLHIEVISWHNIESLTCTVFEPDLCNWHNAAVHSYHSCHSTKSLISFVNLLHTAYRLQSVQYLRGDAEEATKQIHGTESGLMHWAVRGWCSFRQSKMVLPVLLIFCHKQQVKDKTHDLDNNKHPWFRTNHSVQKLIRVNWNVLEATVKYTVRNGIFNGEWICNIHIWAHISLHG